jgi:hypothetical protein
MVLRAFSETSGRILRMTVGAAASVNGLAFPFVDAGFGAGGTGAGAAAAFEIGAEFLDLADSETAGEELPEREFMFGEAGEFAWREFAAGAGASEETLGGGVAEVADVFAAELDFAAAELVAFPDLAAGMSMVAGALEATMGFDDDGALFAGELGADEEELDTAGAAELPERVR